MSAERLEITSTEERPVNTAPAMPKGFLGQLKHDWAETGCQIPDPLEEKIADFKKRAMNREFSSADVGELRAQIFDEVECKKISTEVADKLLDILLNARVSDPDL